MLMDTHMVMLAVRPADIPYNEILEIAGAASAARKAADAF